MPHKKALWFTAKYGPKPPPKKRKPVRRVSKKRQRERVIYNRMAKTFLETVPHCQVHGCRKRSTQVHHMAGRKGSNYLNTLTWMAVCAGCHDTIHRHPAEAMKAGYLKSFHA